MYNVVQKSAFGDVFRRLDAEFVERTAVEYEHKLKEKLGGHVLRNLVKPSKDLGAINKGQLRYIAIDSIDTADGLSFETLYKTPEDLPSRAKYRTKPDDILVSNVRPNRGAVALVREDQGGCIASSGFTLIRLNQGIPLASEYVFAVLKTPYARSQLMRRSRGSMYPAVVRDDVLDLLIPIVDAKIAARVVSLIKDASEYQVAFFKKKKEAEQLLGEFLKPIGAPPSPTTTRRIGVDSTEVRSPQFFSDKGAQRFDAEFFRKEYSEFDKECSQTPNFLLGDKFDLSPGRTLSKTAGSCSYAKQAMLTNIGINWDAVDEEEGAIVKGAWKIQKNDILLACTAHEIPYVGRKCDVVTDVPSMLGDVGCVPDLMILRPKPDLGGISLYYVAAFLRSASGLHQVQRCIRGLRGGHVYKKDLSRYVRIPIPPAPWMKAFDDLEDEAEALRGKAKKAVRMAVEVLNSAFDSAVA